MLNDVTDDKGLFPLSEVFLLRDMQLDTSRAAKGCTSIASPERARQIAGPGASRPEWDGESFSDDLIPSIQSGSPGMPNQTQQAANPERLLPLALQTGGFSPVKIAEGMGMGDDLLGLIGASQPSILAFNTLAGSVAIRPAAPAIKE